MKLVYVFNDLFYAGRGDKRMYENKQLHFVREFFPEKRNVSVDQSYEAIKKTYENYNKNYKRYSENYKTVMEYAFNELKLETYIKYNEYKKEYFFIRRKPSSCL